MLFSRDSLQFPAKEGYWSIHKDWNACSSNGLKPNKNDPVTVMETCDVNSASQVSCEQRHGESPKPFVSSGDGSIFLHSRIVLSMQGSVF